MVRLVRREPGSATEFRWDPDAGTLHDAVLDGVDAVVNLCGVGIADRPLTTKRKEIVRSSRINPTRTLTGALTARLERTGSAPVLLQASATGYYPSEGSDQPLTESAPAGASWISGLVAEWERTAQPAADAGVRVVLLRTSPVIDSSGGLFPVMRRAWSLGAGAVLGDGTQHMPLIQLGDYLRFVLWAAEHHEASGPYNLTLPTPTTNAEFTDELAGQLRRPRFLKAPKAVLSAVLGDFAEQLLGDVWLLPQQATDQGFTFQAPDVATAIAHSLRD
ncbi:TIGR01777 family oxidoreductase [Microlunatus aurantiacus]|uniref:TIGR01777 family oxidoreductase n=1 Tax=Microlunatus aurantiacus TaxID=446786 RepID=A0ABP7DTH9_9ACTN